MSKITDLLGDKAVYYLDHTCKTIDKSMIHIPSSETIDRIWIDSDRNIQTLRSLQLFSDMVVWPIPVMFLFFLLTRILNILQVLLLLRIRFISIRRTL